MDNIEQATAAPGEYRAVPRLKRAKVTRTIVCPTCGEIIEVDDD